MTSPLGPLQRLERGALVRDLVHTLLTGRGWEEVLPRVAPHHTLATPLPFFQPARGDRGLRTLSAIVVRAFSDVEVVVDPLLAADRSTGKTRSASVGARFELKGRHTGTLGVVEPTGRAIQLTGMVVCVFDPDNVDLVETRFQANLLWLFEQLDAVALRDVVASSYF